MHYDPVFHNWSNSLVDGSVYLWPVYMEVFAREHGARHGHQLSNEGDVIQWLEFDDEKDYTWFILRYSSKT